MPEFDFDALRRSPDVEAANLFAVDAADRLILDEAAGALAAAGAGVVVVIGDRYGALTLGAGRLHAVAQLRTLQDQLTGELALDRNARELAPEASYTRHELGEELLSGAHVVLLQLPRSLDALTEIVDAVARHAREDVVLYAGAQLKHMSRAMNEVLSAHFDTVQASLARRKARVLIASGARRPVGEPPFPISQYHQDLGLWLCAHGAAFAGAKVDIGTRFLLNFIPRMSGAGTGIDLGCGTGLLAAAMARAHPDLQVIATDQSTAAVASAAATLAANGLNERARVVRDDALHSFAPASADLIVCNPPFHLGASVHAGAALKLFDAAARTLRPGGELWTVYNSHLGYRGQLERTVGETAVMGRNAKFTVTRSVRRRPPP